MQLKGCQPVRYARACLRLPLRPGDPACSPLHQQGCSILRCLAAPLQLKLAELRCTTLILLQSAFTVPATTLHPALWHLCLAKPLQVGRAEQARPAAEPSCLPIPHQSPHIEAVPAPKLHCAHFPMLTRMPGTSSSRSGMPILPPLWCGRACLPMVHCANPSALGLHLPPDYIVHHSCTLMPMPGPESARSG